MKPILVTAFNCFFCMAIISCVGNQSRKEKSRDSISNIVVNQKQNAINRKPDSVDSAFSGYWLVFADIVKKGDVPVFKKMSLDSIASNGKTISLNRFTHSYFRKVFDSDLKSLLSDSTRVVFSNFEVYSDALPKCDLKKIKIISNVLKQVIITKIDRYPEGPVLVVLDFVETSHGYRFCGWELFGGASINDRSSMTGKEIASND